MAKPLLLLVLSALCAAQDNDVLHTEITNLPSATLLGPPAGTTSATTDYDNASAVSSLTAAMADAATPTPVAGVPPVPMYTGSLDDMLRSIFPGQQSGKRGAAGQPGASRLLGRDLPYPVNTEGADVPSGYTPAFASLNAATQGIGYLSYSTLEEYDPALCAAQCDAINACRFFNIYFEKVSDSDGQPADLVKCSLYSMPHQNTTATNHGQPGLARREELVITGSNGYSKASTPVARDGYNLTTLDGAVSNTTHDKIGQTTLIKTLYFNTYDPDLCTAACDQQTHINNNTTPGCNYQTCVYANMYILNEDGAPQSAVCSLYSQNWDPIATNTSYNAGWHHYDVTSSIGLTNIANAAVYPKQCADACSNATSSCFLGTMGVPENPSSSGAMYSSFSGGASEGAVLQSSSTAGPGLDAAWVGSGTAVRGIEVGYLRHPGSGLCWTMVPPPAANPIRRARPLDDGGRVELRPCGAAAVPPDDQMFGPATSFRLGDSLSYCMVGIDSQSIYGQAKNFPSTPVDTVLEAGGGTCFYLVTTQIASA